MMKQTSTFATAAILAIGNAPAFAEFIYVKQDAPIPEIRVEADRATGKYHRAASPSLAFQLAGRGRGDAGWRLDLGGYDLYSGSTLVATSSIDVNPDNRSYGLSQGQDWVPHTLTMEGAPMLDGRSAAELCNDELARHSAAARAGMVEEGFELGSDALRVRFSLTWEETEGFVSRPQAYAWTDIDVVVHCLGETGVRRDTSTRQGPRPTGVPATQISELTLRAEPGQMQTIDGQTCPTRLFLYGQVQSGSLGFEGQAVIFGSSFIAPPVSIDMPAGSTRNVTATYTVNWAGQSSGVTAGDGFAAAGGNPNALKTQTVQFTLNVADHDDQVIESTGARTFEITCGLSQTNPFVQQSVLPGGGDLQSPDAPGPNPASLPGRNPFEAIEPPPQPFTVPRQPQNGAQRSTVELPSRAAPALENEEAGTRPAQSGPAPAGDPDRPLVIGTVPNPAADNPASDGRPGVQQQESDLDFARRLAQPSTDDESEPSTESDARAPN